MTPPPAVRPATAPRRIAELTRPLRAARAQACAHVEDVLHELGRLRVQIGLATLADEGTQVRLRLGELAARVAAMEEVAGVALRGGASPRSRP